MTTMPQVRNLQALKISARIGVLFGLAMTLVTVRTNPSASGPALGVFFIFLGFNAFTQLRISRVEEAVQKLEKTTPG
jgi:hypothetical protein